MKKTKKQEVFVFGTNQAGRDLVGRNTLYAVGGIVSFFGAILSLALIGIPILIIGILTIYFTHKHYKNKK